jgi:hypothetical protein
MVAGIGFAGYFLCIHQAGEASVFWLAGTSRFVSLLTTGAIRISRDNSARLTEQASRGDWERAYSTSLAVRCLSWPASAEDSTPPS